MIQNRWLWLSAAGAIAVASYLYFGSRYGDAIEARRPSAGDRYLEISLSQLRKDNPQFAIIAHEKIEAIRIQGKRKTCYFIYSSKPIAMEESDFLYCFEGSDMRFLGRM